MKIFTDGGSRGNPGEAGAGFVVLDDQENIIYKQCFYLGKKTNNEAEYLGLLESLRWVSKNITSKKESICWFLDSKLVVEQINKNWKIKEDRLKKIAIQCWAVIKTIPSPIIFSHIPREKNVLADGLANKAMDSEK